MPPQKREVPRTRRRLESTEPSREYFTTKILFLLKANIAIISSVALPHVAFRSPPTESTISRKTSNNFHHWLTISKNPLHSKIRLAKFGSHYTHYKWRLLHWVCTTTVSLSPIVKPMIFLIINVKTSTQLYI